MTQPSVVSTVYCTDEDILVQAGADFVALAAKGPRLAYATDGYFDAGSPWVLNSPSIDFAANGVGSNQVVLLTKGNNAFKGGGEMLAIDSSTSSSITLRWPGQAASVGQAPGFGGVTAVTFEVRTFASQIEDVCFEVNERFAIDAMVAMRSPGDVYNLRILRRLTVLTVLYRSYVNQARTEKGDWAQKVDRYRQDLDEALAKATLRWGPTGNTQQPTTRFSTKLSR